MKGREKTGIDPILATLLALTYLVLTSCSSGTEQAIEAPSVLNGVEIVDSTTSFSENDPEGPQQGGVLVLEVQDCNIPDPAIDIASSRDLSRLTLVHEIHAGLMKPSQVQPIGAETDLAENYNARDDGMLYEFLLRKGLTFSDGTKLTAADVVWSWERSLRKSTGHSRANDVLGDIEGADAVASGEAVELSGVRVVDDRNLEVRLVAPRPDFPLLLTDPVTYVISSTNESEWGHAWVNQSDFPGEITVNTEVVPEKLPVGAGPFKITEYAHPETTRTGYSGQTRCVLERNDQYWGTPAHIDGVIAEVHEDLLWDTGSTFGRQKERFASGELDMTIAYLDEIGDIPDSLEVAQVATPPRVQFVTLNPALPPLEDIYFRRALAMTIDANNKIRKVNGEPNEGRLVPGSLYVGGSQVTVPEMDVDAARAELGKSIYGSTEHLLQIRWSLDSDYFFRYAVSDRWIEELAVSVDSFPFDLKEEVRFEDVQMRIVAASAMYPSPHGVLLNAIDAFGASNDAAEIVEMRTLIADAASELDHAQRLAKYEDIERRLIDDVMVMPIAAYETNVNFLVQPWVKGFDPEKYGGSMFHSIWLDGAAPERTVR